jgi:hypothetical protein
MVRFMWAGWWLGLMAGASSPAAAQVLNPTPTVELMENSPNPLGAATTIPFRISPEICVRGHRPIVTLRILNSLVQVVAIPVLASSAGETALDLVQIDCGMHRAYWNGKLFDGPRDARAGVYYYQLTVDGDSHTRKMIVPRRIAPAY